MADTSPLSIDERSAWRSFIQMQHLLERHLARHLHQEFGLSAADFEVLIHLMSTPGGRLPLRELGQLTHWEKSRLSHQLRRMGERGLICREDAAGRGWIVALTPPGRTLIEQAAPGNRGRVRELFIDPLGPAALQIMAAHSEKIMAALNEHAEGCCDLEA